MEAVAHQYEFHKTEKRDNALNVFDKADAVREDSLRHRQEILELLLARMAIKPLAAGSLLQRPLKAASGGGPSNSCSLFIISFFIVNGSIVNRQLQLRPALC